MWKLRHYTTFNTTKLFKADEARFYKTIPCTVYILTSYSTPWQWANGMWLWPQPSVLKVEPNNNGMLMPPSATPTPATPPSVSPCPPVTLTYHLRRGGIALLWNHSPYNPLYWLMRGFLPCSGLTRTSNPLSLTPVYCLGGAMEIAMLFLLCVGVPGESEA